MTAGSLRIWSTLPDKCSCAALAVQRNINTNYTGACPSEQHAENTSGLRADTSVTVRNYLARHAVHSASFDAAERGDPPKCHPETRLVVQDSLVAWRNNPKAGPVRLISGWAGTGKTTIAQTMAEYWARQGQLGGSFFFSTSSLERSTTERVYETIFHQFLQRFGANMDVGHLLGAPIVWDEVVGALVSTLPSLPLPVVIVIDGLDECRLTTEQVLLLRGILGSLDKLGSIKFLISCRPERHLENVFREFAEKLGPSYDIYLGQSAEDNDDIRTFFRVSFDRICQDRRQDEAMSITDGPWPSQEEVEELVDWASGQFIFAETVVRFVDDENEDPVEMLDLVLEHRTSSFGAIDQLYIVILNRVGEKLDKCDKPLQRRQLMQNLILHIKYEPSSSLAIAEFWFEKEVTINILVKHLRALLVRPTTNARGQVSQNLIQFRHKSFDDFLARPSAPHPFSLSEMNPVSKFFFSLRMHAREAASGPDIWVFRGSQQLGYAFLRCHDYPPTIFPYEEEARRLHQAMVPIAMAVDRFIREWKEWEDLRTISFPILKFLLWLRIISYSLLSDPSAAFYGSIKALIPGCPSLNRLLSLISLGLGFNEIGIRRFSWWVRLGGSVAVVVEDESEEVDEVDIEEGRDLSVLVTFSFRFGWGVELGVDSGIVKRLAEVEAPV
ncbi:hypothetical protein BDN72DRAFT_862902 [Pluteus cervinus]|uniref:Uncharacterized protein n=1 Tax=Pluteus cervinus TaxID=181527 RepID=A0ACD3A911_9AGAR|nr:hypothetical protein BDN72DRAFT_862902 [Pluteus cervinus]